MECISTEVTRGEGHPGGPRTERAHPVRDGQRVLEQRNPRYTPGRMRPQIMDWPHGGGVVGRHPPDPRAHLLICSSICFTSSDSLPLSPPGAGGALGPPSLGSGAPLSSNERPRRARTRLDRMSRIVSV